MQKLSKYLRDAAITIVLLLLAFAVSLLCQRLDVEEHTTTVHASTSNVYIQFDYAEEDTNVHEGTIT